MLLFSIVFQTARCTKKRCSLPTLYSGGCPICPKSPSSSLGETLADEYTFPVYNPTFDSNEVVPYPTKQTMSYLKPDLSQPTHLHPRVRPRTIPWREFHGHQFLSCRIDARARMVRSTIVLLNESIIIEVIWLGNAAAPPCSRR